MGLLDWVKKSRGEGRLRKAVASAKHTPCFEQLEPRVLLSADGLTPLEFPLYETQSEAAIYVDLEIDQAVSQEPLALSQEENGLEVKKVGNEEGKTVGQSDSLTVERSTGLPVSQLTTAANLTTAQENENKTSPADLLCQGYEGQDASENSIMQNSEFIIQNPGLSSAQTRGPPTEIIFIDSSLKLDFQLENAHLTGVLVSVFDVDSDGIAQITSVLSSYSNLSAIHIVSHGAPGQVFLGTTVLDSSTLDIHAESLAAWGTSLATEGDILLYGCSVAQGQVGQKFVQKIAVITGADMAVSDNPTGGKGYGGDWVLEQTTGVIEALPLIAEFNRLLLSDFGDAPTSEQTGFANSYPTTLDAYGANHLTTGPTLGTNRDSETDGQPTLAADGDDITGTPDDEDGMVEPVVLRIGGTTETIDIIVAGTGDSKAYLDAWIDFNQDGTWDNASEKICSCEVIEGTNTLIFAVPADAVVGTTYARFRLNSSAPGLGPTGLASDGEVEDYQVSINGPDLSPYKWDHWDDSLVISIVPTVDGNPYTDASVIDVSDTVYVNAALWNASGSLNTGVGFDSSLVLDGTVISNPYFGDVGPGYVGELLNFSIGLLSAGSHTLVWAVDYLNDVIEKDETNNIRTRTFTVAGIVVSAISGNTTESGGTGTFTVVLTSEPNADVTIGLSSSDTSEGTVAPTSVTFTSGNWDTAQTVTVTGVNDSVDDGDIAYTIMTSAATSTDPNYDGIIADDVAVTNEDDDTAGITVTPMSGLTTTEAGGTASFTVVLDSEPTADVSIVVTSTDTTEGTVSTGQLVFTSSNWSAAQTVTVTGVDDAVDDGDVAYAIGLADAVSVDGKYSGINPTDVGVTNQDDDSAPVANAGGPYTINEGDSLNLDASGTTDADSTTITYRWDVDGDGDYDENVTGEQPTLTWGELVALGIDDGPYGPQSMTVEASDGTNVYTDVSMLTVINVSPILVLDAVAAIDENGTATLTGTITDPGTLDTFTLTIDWGEGTPQTVAVTGGSFDMTHQYLDDNPSSTPWDVYTIDVTLTDDDTGTDTDSTTTTITNVNPVIDSLSATSVNENGIVHLTGTYSDVGTQDTHKLSIDWGEGVLETVVITGGSFDIIHQYLDDNPTNTASDVYGISVTLTDDDTGATTDSTTTTITNANPVIDSLSASSVDENGIVHLTGTYSDTGTQDTHTLTINWGEGLLQTVAVSGGSFDIVHQYLDDNPVATASDVYTINATLADDDTGTDTGSATTTITNVNPVINSLAATSVNENGTVHLTGTYSDTGTQDTHELTINWGEGSLQTVTMTGGTFDITHQYLDDNPTATASDVYTIDVTLTDDDTGTDTGSTTTTVTNVAPVIDSLSATSVNENGTVHLTGTYNDIGTQDTHSLTIDWGEGSPQIVAVSGGAFDITHQYLDDDLTGTLSDVYTISVTLTDDDTGTDTDSTTTTITNVNPVIDSLSATSVNENGTVHLTGTYSDIGTQNTHELTIDWGEGSSQIVAVTGGTFDITHQYLDDNPTNTPSDLYTIGVTLTDDDGDTDTGNTTITITNVAPVINSLVATSVDENGMVHLTGTYSDIGTQDTHELTIDWGEGSPQIVDVTGGTFDITHQYLDDNPTYTLSDLYTINVTLTDDDAGTDTGSTTTHDQCDANRRRCRRRGCRHGYGKHNHHDHRRQSNSYPGCGGCHWRIQHRHADRHDH